MQLLDIGQSLYHTNGVNAVASEVLTHTGTTLNEHGRQNTVLSLHAD